MMDFVLNNGLKIPAIGLGTWKSEPNQVYEAVKHAIKVGYTHIDCAAIYENEKEVGQALKDSFDAKYINRESLWITSKLWCNRFEPADVEAALDKTLADLRVSYLDLYLIHWPVAFKSDVTFAQSMEEFVSPDESLHLQAWKVLEGCVRKGKVKSIGVSNFGPSNLKNILQVASIPPAVNQIELHPFLQQKELLKTCEENRIHVTAYSPLGSLDRPDVLRSEDEPRLIDHPKIVGLAKKLDVTPAGVLIAWALSRGTSVIPKSVNPSRIEENLKSAKISLEPALINEINQLEQDFRFVDGRIFLGDKSPYTFDYLWT